MTPSEERSVKYAKQLTEVRWWLVNLIGRRALGGYTDQAVEQVKFIDEALAEDNPGPLLARVDVLERAAITAHKLASEEGLPGILREAADKIEQIRAALDATGYDEWHMLSGLGER